MKQGTQSQCSGTTQGDRVRREVGGWFRLGVAHGYLWLINVDYGKENHHNTVK